MNRKKDEKWLSVPVFEFRIQKPEDFSFWQSFACAHTDCIQFCDICLFNPKHIKDFKRWASLYLIDWLGINNVLQGEEKKDE